MKRLQFLLFLCGLLVNPSQLLASEGSAASSHLEGRGETKPSDDARQGDFRDTHVASEGPTASSRFEGRDETRPSAEAREEAFEYQRVDADPWAIVNMEALDRELPFPTRIKKVSDFHALPLAEKVAFLMGFRSADHSPDLSKMKQLSDLPGDAQAVLRRLISRLVPKLGILANPDLQLILEHVVCATWKPEWFISQPFGKFEGARTRALAEPYRASVAAIYRAQRELGNPITDEGLESNLGSWNALPGYAATYVDNYESMVDRFIEREFFRLKALYLLNSDRLIARARLEHEELARAQARISEEAATAKARAEKAERESRAAADEARKRSTEATEVQRRIDTLSAGSGVTSSIRSRQLDSLTLDSLGSSRLGVAGRGHGFTSGSRAAGSIGFGVKDLLSILEEVRKTPYHVLAGMDWERMTAIMKETIVRDTKIKSQQALPPLSAVLKNPEESLEAPQHIEKRDHDIFLGTLQNIYRTIYDVNIAAPDLPRSGVKDFVTLHEELSSSDPRATKFSDVFPKSLAYWMGEHGLEQKLARLSQEKLPYELANVVMTIGGDSRFQFRTATDQNLGDDLLTKAFLAIKDNDLVSQYEEFVREDRYRSWGDREEEYVKSNFLEAAAYFENQQDQPNFIKYLVMVACGTRVGSTDDQQQAHLWLKYFEMLRIMRSESLVLLSGWIRALPDETEEEAIKVAENSRIWSYEKNLNKDARVLEETRSLKIRLLDLLVVKPEGRELKFFQFNNLERGAEAMESTFLSEDRDNFRKLVLKPLHRNVARDIFSFVLLPTEAALGVLEDREAPFPILKVMDFMRDQNKRHVRESTSGKSIRAMREELKRKFESFINMADRAFPADDARRLERRTAIAAASVNLYVANYESKYKDARHWRGIQYLMEARKKALSEKRKAVSKMSNFIKAEYLDRMMKETLGEDYGLPNTRTGFQSQYKDSPDSPKTLEDHIVFIFDILDSNPAPRGGAGGDAREDERKRNLFREFLDLSSSLDLGNVALQIRFYNLMEKLVKALQDLYAKSQGEYPWLFTDILLPDISVEHAQQMRLAIQRVLASFILDRGNYTPDLKVGKPLNDRAPKSYFPVQKDGSRNMTKSFALVMYNSFKRSRDFTDALEVLKAFADERGYLSKLRSEILGVMEHNDKLMLLLAQSRQEGAKATKIDNTEDSLALPEDFAYRVDGYWPDTLHVMSATPARASAGGGE